jgi:hypothetical protein
MTEGDSMADSGVNRNEAIPTNKVPKLNKNSLNTDCLP